jgi:amino acid permease
MLLRRTLSASIILLLIPLLLLIVSSSSSSGRVQAFGSQHPLVVLSFSSSSSSSSSSTCARRRSSSSGSGRRTSCIVIGTRKSRLYVSSSTPTTKARQGILQFFHNQTLSSAFSVLQSSEDDVFWSKNDEDHAITDKSSCRRPLIQKEEDDLLFRLQSTVLPVVSSALLITGSTFGAGSLVLPELAQGVGLANTLALFLGAYVMNLISGLCIAQVAIQQQQQKINQQLDDMEASSATSSASTLSPSSFSSSFSEDSQQDDKHRRQQQKSIISVKKKTKKSDGVVDVPCSFQAFVASTTGSHALASFISAVSFGVNSLVWAFCLSRVGILASQVLFVTTTTSSTSSSVICMAASTLWAVGLVLIFATQTPGRISHGASVFVTPALFASFAALLVPGLAAVPEDFITVLSQPGLASDSSSSSSLAALAPVVYMSTIYQNVVPTVAKLQNYHPTRTMAAIVLGSAMPLVMYLSWCYACLGGGIDLEALTKGSSSSSDGGGGGGMTGLLLTVFSLATLAGSSIGLGLSCASEINTFVKATLHGDSQKNQADNEDGRFPLPTVLASVGLPLLICQVFGHGGQVDLTGALSVAGGLGSPLLYGIIPVVMAWKQSQSQQQQKKLDSQTAAHNSSFSFLPAFLRQHYSNTNNKASLDFAKQMDASTTTTTSFVPASSLGVLGVFSTGMLGSEIVGQVSQVLASAATSAAGTSTVVVPVAAVVEQVEEMAMVAMAAAPL